ncbi:winged helix-turn-helix transcriptional regulator [Methanocella conradii]|uniref:winged helix-turn-helix transcriptional regulator n=1 Tax=Methanocella conradii TaxID=1175444 RepID=UPI00157D2D36|nr:winged helix-turn-helix transcriptional regulator [Methanocella conradii]
MGCRRALFESLLAIAAILLIFLIYLMVSGYAFTTTETRATVKWDAPGNGTIYHLLACEDGTLRALMDGRISAISSDGSILWYVDVPDRWWMGSRYFEPAADVGPDGTLYVYLRANVTRAAMERGMPYAYAGEYYVDMDEHNKRLMDAYKGTEFAYSLDERVLAISRSGEILWSLPLATGLYNADISVRNGTVYVYHGQHETAIDEDGGIIWDVGDVGAAPAVDDEGYVYSLVPINGSRTNGRVLTGIVQAYYPNGTAWWRRDVGELAYLQPIQGWEGHMPLYDHGTLYLALSSGVAALDRTGSVKWLNHYNSSTALFELGPFDGEGNVYLRCFDGAMMLNEGAVLWDTYYPVDGSRLIILRPDGAELASVANSTAYAYAKDGVAYRVDPIPGGHNLTEIGSAVLTAMDLKGNRTLWSYSFTPGEISMAMLNMSNVKGLLMADDVRNAQWFNGMNARGLNVTPTSVSGNVDVTVVQGRDVTYVGFWTYRYDSPAIYNVSRVAYSGGLYAFNRAGDVLWSRPIDARIGSMHEKDGAIYYSTGSGRLAAAQVDIVTGLAIAAAMYLFTRFIMVGAISRARGVINKNDNRNAILKYIVENPGSTMYEISRSLGLNKGTVRYHLFILGINHRIAVQRADKKFVRYFPNSNSYSEEEQMLMALLRRESIRRVMEALMKRPGLSNVELSRELDLPESAMSKHMKELCSRGIVDKRRMPGGISYHIKEEFRGLIARALDQSGQ